MRVWVLGEILDVRKGTRDSAYVNLSFIIHFSIEFVIFSWPLGPALIQARNQG